MFVRYGLAAILAALATLMGTVVWAQEARPQGVFVIGLDCCQESKCCAAKNCCAASACSKDGKCCKDGECCCKSKKCDAGCACCKDNKCACGKGGECGCAKSGKCGCKDKNACCGKSGEGCCAGKTACGCKDKASVKKIGHGSCPFLNKLAKNTAIIMVMPSSLPLLGACHPEVMGMLPHPPLPMGPHVMMPVPLPPPPMMTPPGLPVPTMTPPVMPPQTVALPNPLPAQPQGYPCPQPVVLPAPCAANPPVQASTTVDTCLELLDVASEVCSLMHPNRPSLCASALELLMMGMCPKLTTVESYPATPYVMHPPQCVPPAPSLPQRCDLAYPTTPVGTTPPQSCPNVCPCPTATASTTVVPCAIATPTNAAKVRVIATPSGDKVEMNIGDATCIRCKKMTVKIGENEITLSCFDDRVRIRGEELKATADCVRSDRKDHLILEGDVVLRYKKDGHSANVTGDRIELNLSSGAVTIKPAAKTTVRPAVRLDVIDAVGP